MSIKPILKETSSLTFSFKLFSFLLATQNINILKNYQKSRNIIFKFLNCLLLNLVEKLHCQNHKTAEINILLEDRKKNVNDVVYQ